MNLCFFTAPMTTPRGLKFTLDRGLYIYIYPLTTDSILLMEEIRANQLGLVVYPII